MNQVSAIAVAILEMLDPILETSADQFNTALNVDNIERLQLVLDAYIDERIQLLLKDKMTL